MNFNKAIIIGNLTQNPEVKTTPTGQSVSSFGVATNRVWTDKGGQKQSQVEFHTVVAWGRLAEIVGQYLTKGGLIMVEGRIQTRNWTDQQGVKHWKTEIIAENIQLGPRNSSTAGSNSSSSSSSNNNYAQSAPSESSDQTVASDDDIKVEDIPF